MRYLGYLLRRVPSWLIVAFVVASAGTLTAAWGADGQDDTGQTKMSLLELLLKGKWFMVPIGLCSLLGLALIIERLIAVRRSAVTPVGFVRGLEEVLQNHDRFAAMQYCRENGSPIARVTQAGLRRQPKGDQAVEEAISNAGGSEVAKLRRNLRLLYGVSAVAPMLGLLGTVWGMIEAFQVASAIGLGRAEKLATGIYEALVTTFAGLTVAIPTLIFYYYFQSKIDRIVTEMDDVSTYLVEEYLGEAPAPPQPEEV